jgi:hypothetical protein
MMCRKSSAILLFKQKVNNLTSSTGLDENHKKVPPCGELLIPQSCIFLFSNNLKEYTRHQKNELYAYHGFQR